jgi:hypothetical protein
MILDDLFHSEESSQKQLSLNSSIQFTEKFRNNLHDLLIPCNWQLWVDRFPSSPSADCVWSKFYNYIDSKSGCLNPTVVLLLLWCCWGNRAQSFKEIAVLEIFTLANMVRIRFNLDSLKNMKKLAQGTVGSLTELPFVFSVEDIQVAFQLLTAEQKKEAVSQQFENDSISSFNDLVKSNNLLQFLLQFFRSSSYTWTVVRHLNSYLQFVSIPIKRINGLSSIAKGSMKSLMLKDITSKTATDVLVEMLLSNPHALELCCSVSENSDSLSTKDALRLRLLNINTSFEFHTLFDALGKFSPRDGFYPTFKSMIDAEKDAVLWLAVAEKHNIVWDDMTKRNSEKTRKIREEFSNFPFDAIYKPLWFWLELRSFVYDSEIHMAVCSIDQTIKLTISLYSIIITYELFYSLLRELRLESSVSKRFDQFLWRRNRPFFQELWYACPKSNSVLPIEIFLAFSEVRYYHDLWKILYYSDSECAAKFATVRCDELISTNQSFLAFWLWYSIGSSAAAVVNTSTLETRLASSSIFLSLGSHLIEIPLFGDLLVFLLSMIQENICTSLTQKEIIRSLKFLLFKGLQLGQSPLLELIFEVSGLWKFWKQVHSSGSFITDKRWEDIQLSEVCSADTHYISSLQLKRLLWASFLTGSSDGKPAELVQAFRIKPEYKLKIAGIAYSDVYTLSVFLFIFERYDDILKSCNFLEGSNFWEYLLLSTFQNKAESNVASVLSGNKRLWKLWGERNRVEQDLWDEMFYYPQKLLLWNICASGKFPTFFTLAFEYLPQVLVRICQMHGALLMGFGVTLRNLSKKSTVNHGCS